MDLEDLYAKLINHKVIALSVLGLLIGVMLYLITNSMTVSWGTTSPSPTPSALLIQSFLRDIGSLLVSTATLALLFDVLFKRSFADELSAKFRLSREVELFGIKHFTFDPTDRDHGIYWTAMFKSSTELDVYFIHGIKWQLDNLDNLREMCAKKNAKVRVLLPDLDNPCTLRGIVAGTGKDITRLESDIRDAIHVFSNIDSSPSSVVEVRLSDVVPPYTLYRFSNTAVVSFKSSQHRKSDVPHFVSGEGGKLYDFVNAEFNALWARARSI